MVVVTDKFLNSQFKENWYLQLLIINTTNKIIIKNCVQHSHTCKLRNQKQVKCGVTQGFDTKLYLFLQLGKLVNYRATKPNSTFQNHSSLTAGNLLNMFHKYDGS